MTAHADERRPRTGIWRSMGNAYTAQFDGMPTIQFISRLGR
jgi:hypothetical protein